MLTRSAVAAILAIGFLALASTAPAQSESTKDKSLFDRIDDAGRTIFGGLLPAKKPKPQPQSPAADGNADTNYARKPFNTRQEGDEHSQRSSRAGSILGSGARNPGYTVPAARRMSDYRPDDTMPESVRREAAPSRPNRRPVVDRSLLDEDEFQATPERRQPTVPARRSLELPDEQPVMELPSEPAVTESNESQPVAERQPSQPAREAAEELPEPSSTPRPVLRPLHERLSGFRHSVFSDQSSEKREPLLQPERQEAVKSPLREPKAANPSPALQPLTAQRPQSEPKAAVTTSPDTPASNAPSVANASTAITRPNAPDVLFVRKSPVLNVETIGPRTISVGREARYEVTMINSGEVAAEELSVFVSVPDWAQIVAADASLGNVQPAAAEQGAKGLLWRIGTVGAKGRERLTVRIVPRQSRPFDLAVRWESKPTSSQAMIEVQEPRLMLQLEGPKDVLYGKKQTYRLRLSNTGNGNAENVVLTLTPIGAGENLPAAHKVGLLAAGGEKVLDVELVPRQPGALTIQADARANGVAMAELTEKVNVRRGALKLDCEAPKVQFVGTVTTATVHVRNTGTAAVRNSNFVLSLPMGAKYLSGIEGARVDANGSKVEWTVENLDPQTDLSFTLKCSMTAAGVNRLHVGASAEDDLFTSAEAIVRVEAVANIRLEVKDPAAPVPIGEQGVYEVRVRNRGTKEAQGIEVIGYFSQGIEPVNATGAPNRFGEGQVTFQPIDSLAPGAEVVFKIYAKAETPGNHVFRAEARCRALNTRLIREATNLYYAENGATEPPPAVMPGPVGPNGPTSPGPAAYDAMRMPPSQGVQMLAPPPRR